MYLQHEESVNKDIKRICDHIKEMAQYTENSLNECVLAFLENNHQIAYGIILRDLFIDEKEKEIDRLCLEFIIKQQPVSKPLRFVLSTIKINMEIERIGDYAESMARHILSLDKLPEKSSNKKIVELANHSINMFHDSVQAFLNQSEEQARNTLAIEDRVDSLRSELISELLAKSIDLEEFLPLLTIVRRFERVADQARNICMEILYLCTGENAKHPGAEAFRILFVDAHNSIRSQIAEAVANSLEQERFIFNSAGIDPQPINSKTIDFMKKKGFDLSKVKQKAFDQVPNIEYYQVIAAFSSKAKKLFPQEPRKTIYLDWHIDDPSTIEDDDKALDKAYETTFQFIKSHVTDLINAIVGTDNK